MTPSPEAIRSRLLADPNTPKLAEQLGVPLEKYVQQVVHFVQNPQEEPQLLVVEDEDLRAMGHEPPEIESLDHLLDEAVAVADLMERTDFTPAKKPLVSLTGLPETPVATPSAPARTDTSSDLDAQLRRGRFSSNQGK
ncbi:hypothetical protein [Archangium lipolyticum]|uniref:hypothetical protein n=1 Tax=Archangium lipolyticum TaxID=2970465 RepID=UPI00214A5BD4|nr:hypothetical protein [Archangium lipolyticum]